MLAFVVAVCCVAPDLETGTMIGKAESGAITYEYRLKIPCIICVNVTKGMARRWVPVIGYVPK